MKTIQALIVACVLGCQLQAQVSFNLSSSPGVGNDPNSVAVAEVNGDGKMDLVCANYYGNSLSVLTNNGSGSFVLSGTYTVGNLPIQVTAADVNRDGKMDLICANSAGTDSSLSVLTNNGSGGFVLAGTYPVGLGPVSVTAADVNRDGWVDLISANQGNNQQGNTLTVLTNNGSGGFVLAGTCTVGRDPYSVTAADVNRDGKVDLICANKVDGTLTVLTNNGSGGFVLAGTNTVDNGPAAVTAADINGDGWVDLISANYGGGGGNTLTVLTNNGSGIFGSNATLTVGSGPLGVAAADVNGNGKVDLISANYNANTLTVLTNNGVGGFVLATNLSVGGSPNSVVAADVNGDGKVDLISPLYPANVVAVFTNATVFPMTPIITSFSPLSGAVGAVVTISGANFSPVAANNTVYFGVVQAAVSAASATNLVVSVPAGATYAPVTETVNGLTAYSGAAFSPTFLGSASISSNAFSPQITLQAPAGQNGVTVADIDGDGKPDLVTANYHDGTISVYRNISSNGVVGTNSFAAPITISVGSETAEVAAGDLTGDGRLDLVAVNQTSGTVSVLKNTSTPGNISFAPKFDLATVTDCRSVIVRDLDGDGKPDIVVASVGSAVVSIYRNISQPGSLTTNSFAPRVDFATANTALTVTAGDLNGDGKPDLVTGNGNSISIFRNTSTPGIINSNSFAPRVDVGISSVWGVAIGDVDGDGRPDLLAANMNNDTMTVLRNTTTAATNITFATGVTFATGSFPYWVALGDLNGDAEPDVVVSDAGGNTVSVFQNKSSPGSFDTNSLGPRMAFRTVGGSRDVVLADMDGDGRLDIVACNLEGGPYVSVLQNVSPFAGVVNPPLHFVWNQIPSPRFVNTPFNVLIQALNPSNTLATNFTSTVALQSTNGVPVYPAVSGNFIQGVWTGTVTIARSVNKLVLQANDSLGEFGQANSINVISTPALTPMPSGNTLLIFWPVSPTGFVLETTAGLAPANWVPVTNAPYEFGNLYLLPVPMSGTNAFFRLKFNGP